MLEAPQTIEELISSLKMPNRFEKEYVLTDNNGEEQKPSAINTIKIRSFFYTQSCVQSLTAEHMNELINLRIFDIYKESFNSNSPAHILVHNPVALKKYLRSFPADINALNDDGATPISFAVTVGRLESFELLRKLGADLTIADNKFKTLAHTVAELHNPDNNRDLSAVARKIAQANVWLFHKRDNNEQSALDICLASRKKKMLSPIIDIVIKAHLEEISSCSKVVGSMLLLSTNAFLLSYNILGIVSMSTAVGILPKLNNTLKINKKTITSSFVQKYLPVGAAAFMITTALCSAANHSFLTFCAYNLAAIAAIAVGTFVAGYHYLKSSLTKDSTYSEKSFETISEAAKKLYMPKFLRSNVELAPSSSRAA